MKTIRLNVSYPGANGFTGEIFNYFKHEMGLSARESIILYQNPDKDNVVLVAIDMTGNTPEGIAAFINDVMDAKKNGWNIMFKNWQ